jgi:hypothetical protein
VSIFSFQEDESLPTPPEHIRHLVSTEIAPLSISYESSPSQTSSLSSNEQVINNVHSSQPSELDPSSIQTTESNIQTDNTNSLTSHQNQTIETKSTTRTLTPQERQRRKNRKTKQKALKRAAQQSISISNEATSNNS